MGRELRRVPLDFDAPLREVWRGYRTPEEFCFPDCVACGGTGYGREARAVLETFYQHQIASPRADVLAWHDKIGQTEVDNLIAEGRLRVWDEGEWVTKPRTAAEVNAMQHGHGIDGHDGINRHILVKFRCQVLGIDLVCPVCEGEGNVARPGQRAAADAWEPTEPPDGDGYQLWETTSAGSPVSPVFATLEALCEYAADHCTVFGSVRASSQEWKHMLDRGLVASEWADGDGNRVVFL